MPGARSAVLPYAATIFLSAFLLFLVQPIIAKQILPWFGGSSAVWTTALVFFQSTLLAGYAYADLTQRLGVRRQTLLHVGLLLFSLLSLPILASTEWKPQGDEAPIAPHSAAARRDDRPAVLPAVDDDTVAAGVVLAPLPRGGAVPAVRAVELRLAAGTARLPGAVRAVAVVAAAWLGVVGAVRRLRGDLCCDGVDIVARHASGRLEAAPQRMARRRPPPLRRSRCSCAGCCWRRWDR